MADPFWVTGGVGDGDGATLRDAEEWEAVEAGGVHHRLQVADPRLEGVIGHVPV